VLITVEVAADPTGDQQARFLSALSETAIELLSVRPDQLRVTARETEPEARTRGEHQTAIAKMAWTGC
jgi:hypothetical protein